MFYQIYSEEVKANDLLLQSTFMDFIPKIAFDFPGIVFLVFCFVVLVQLLFLFLVNFRLLKHKPKEKLQKLPPVTVIICARNEEDNLFKNLPLILGQDYPDFEVIVVNDQSVDDSRHIIQAFQKKYTNLRLIEMEKNKHRRFGKKVPLTVGIKGAKYEKLAFTDADCQPRSKQWLKHLVANYTEGKEIVIGYGAYEKQKGFLNKFIRFDTTSIAANYLGAAKLGRPYMAVGRNMSYLKETFFKVDGFRKHYHIQSGDDDLFMQDTAERRNVAIELHPESFVYSTPKTSWGDWIRQKQRHYTTAGEYRLINKLFLGIFPASMLLMLVSLVILLFNYQWWAFVLAVFGLRILLYWLINGLLFRKLEMGDLVALYPFYELMHFCVMPFIFYSTKGGQSSKW